MANKKAKEANAHARLVEIEGYQPKSLGSGSAQDEWTRIKTSDFVKADSGKLQWSLLPFEELKDVVRVLMLGAKKYTPDNWKKCDDVTRYKDALMRHVISYVSGDITDEESGLSHLAHAVCNCLFLMYFNNTKEEK